MRILSTSVVILGVLMLLFAFLESVGKMGADEGAGLLRLAEAIAGIGVILGGYVLRPK